jgi:hypothetical protein
MDSAFRTFLNNIKLTDLQKADAETKIKSVSETLHAKYYPTLTYDGSTKLLIGSYGKHTHIRPPKDIDLLFKMPDSEFARFDGLAGNKQSQLLQEIRNLLKDKFHTTEEIKAWGKVILISFTEGTHTVELLPAWRLPTGEYRIPNTENGGSWDIWNPSAEIKAIHDSSTQTKHTKSLVRMLKAWVRNCGVPLKSFILEILVIDYLRDQYNNEVDERYPQLVLGFFEYLKSKRNGSVHSLGSGRAISLGDEWSSRVDSAVARAQKAIEYEADEKLRDASLEWQKIFGSDFPTLRDQVALMDPLVEKIAQLTRAYPSLKEQDITRDYGIQINHVLAYEVVIDAEVTQNGFRTGWLTDFLKKRFPLLKGKKLKFRIQKITVPEPFDIMWKVRNFGEEAKKAEGLRGEISYDFGSREKTETTLYHGEHYVECYVIKDGVCVAVGKVLVPIASTYE